MYVINQLKINVQKIIDKNETGVIANELSKVLRANVKDIIIVKKSLDARKKPDLFYIYNIAFNFADVDNNPVVNKILNNKKFDISIYNPVKFCYEKLKIDVKVNPIIIGSGPAGLFAAYSLVQSGLRPVVIERGKTIDERELDIEEFWNGGKLNTNSNVQFGEGGAGTFSDGKLNTGIKDKTGRITEVLNIFVKFGAPIQIKYINKPHIGTDILKTVISNMRNYLIENGVIFRFNTKLDELIISNHKLTGITVINNNGEKEDLCCDKLILAIGHSARDTFLMLNKLNVPMENKPFAVGLRVMHNQELIDLSQYGATEYKLPAADYKLTTKVSSGRGIYSFCMCPGGYVVNASSEDKRLCINGMSYSKRNSGTANSAIVVTIDENDYGTNLLDGMYFQRELEENAFRINNGSITVQRLIDFKNNAISHNSGKTPINIKGQYTFGRINDVLPKHINNDIIEAFDSFGRSIKGFDNDDACLCAIEARTSSPIRILRNDNCESNIKGLYPCGEGAGYAGGITSAAVDGLKVANSLVFEYNIQG